MKGWCREVALVFDDSEALVFEPLPEGTYDVVVDTSESEEFADDDVAWFTARLIVENHPELSGRSFPIRLYVKGKGSGFFAQFVSACGMEPPKRGAVIYPRDYHGKRIRAVTNIRSGKNGGNFTNVRRYLPRSEQTAPSLF